MDLDSIIEDITAFSDPFSDVRIRNAKGKSIIEMTRNGRPLHCEIDSSSGRITNKRRAGVFGGIQGLLASEDFSNIRGFAATQMKALGAEKGASIPTRINISGNTIESVSLVDKIPDGGNKTSLILVDGPAGVGKTYQIKQMVRVQAQRVLSGKPAPPVLHITSHGRRLSNFKDVLAATTQDLNASFGARHVPILVRHGLLIAAIDGFDEMVDADGYEDSWLALRDFLSDVGSGGKVVLGARDTFVEEQELLKRIGRTSEKVALTMAHVLPVSSVDAVEWLRTSPKWKQADIDSQITKDILKDGSYALRPFFLSVLREAGGWSKINETGPRSYLVGSLVGREAKLIAQQIGGITAEVVAPVLNSLFQEIALEMASRENHFIELEHLAFLTEYAFDGVLEENSIRKLAHKAGSFALLEISGIKSKRKFPHTEIQYFFLGGSLLRSLEMKIIPSVLRRAIFVSEHLEAFSDVFVMDESAAKRASEFLASAVSGDMSMDGLSSNGGALLILGFSLGLLPRVDYLQVGDATLAGGAPNGLVNESNFSRLDATGADLSKVVFTSTNVATLVVDENTKFGQKIPAVESLEIRGRGLSRIERDSEKILQFITEHSVLADVPADNQCISLLEKIARRSLRQFYLKEASDDDDAAVLLKDAHWPRVKAVLNKYERIDVVKGKQMHGRPAPLVRIRNPASLLDSADPETKEIHRALLGESEG